MGVVRCCRCDSFVDLDYAVDDVVVMKNGIDWCCRGCLDEDEFCPNCDNPKWDCDCKVNN